ncbi:signal recognition particle SEC65 subunit [Suhomyces tanzawaensis NRRL Y-17324]|uniref:Signal recognition particle SEC65 subunit n=1 Tax=Suhomyces tanzawaensis NRRL Y-17324 TaxID=984487 RepID=A0A1E4SRT8_9ASCO|nr:signal recognition particle SEC65 subunit [Suhomyces tanzawaensis NRRL Y-17324]ODV82221.1 signal recognition particle SEC65 subunit [Suhomyces tanzawaensis NRRL Y-17324]
MSKRPTLEEVDDDIDNMDMDIAEFDPSLRTPVAPLRPQPQVTRSQDQEFGNFPIPPNMQPTPAQNQQVRKNDIVDPKDFSQEEREQLQRFQIIYPCYFDVQRSHKEGRRVSEKNAVFNPLAKTISDACRALKLPVLLELDKTHPQDFGNPGRVRVMIKDSKAGGKVVDPRFQNKRLLLNTIAAYLKDHPTTLASIGPKSGIALPPEFEHGFEAEEIPQVRGFKMNSIVPVHSNFTLKHPMTKSIYDPEPEEPQYKAPIAPKQPKKKVMKIRG